MRRLSKPATALQTTYDVVVVGSGYGGGIAASRLARAGRSVCVLERGREYVEGAFPDTAIEALGALQVNSRHGRVKGDESDLYDVHIDREISVLRGAGVGGTSLINANVSLRADPRVFDDARWPSALRADLGEGLEQAYARAEAMLRPTPYPAGERGWPDLPKYRNLARSAAHLGAEIHAPPINVNFDVDGPNHVGVEQRPCTLCGDCVSGCNHGAKNTVAMTYLPDAVNHGAEIFTGAAVRSVERDGESWVVWFDLVDRGRERFDDAPARFVRAEVVVLAAGALGSTEILLRSKARGLSISQRIGQGFSGNGDALAFSFNGDSPVNGIGIGARDPDSVEPVGPCITGVIDLRAPDRPLDEGYVIEDGTPPGIVARMQAEGLAAGALSIGDDPKGRLSDEARAAARQIVGLARGPYEGASLHSQTYLVMAHDDSQGALRLEDDRLRIDWPEVGRQSVFERIADGLKQAAAAVNGTYVPNPAWSELQSKSLVTVHPLGGCCMGEDDATGVVDHAGRVFDGQGGVHPGLLVADGAIVPRSVGVNPLLTISALAERCMAHLIADRGWAIDYALPSRPAQPLTTIEAPGVEFTERMAGFVSLDETVDYDGGFERGERDGDALSFVLTITVPDVDAFLADPDRRARMAGTVECRALSPAPLSISDSGFQLFSADHDNVDTTEMWYRMRLTAKNGQSWHFAGFKTVRDDPGMDWWRDTTTLYVTIRRGDAEGPIAGRGRLHISPTDLVRQISTMRGIGSTRRRDRLRALGRFGAAFAGDMWRTYGGVTAPASLFDPNAEPRKRRPLRAPVPEIHPIRTRDGVGLGLTRYRGGSKGPIMLVHGAGVSSRIFTVDTIETNLVEYLCAHDYDVWLLDWRASVDLPSAETLFDCDDAGAHDYPAAIDRIRDVTGAADVQVLAHCVGALTFFMSLLRGLEGVRSVAASQVSLHPIGGALVKLKSALHLPTLLRKLGVDGMSARTDTETGWRGRLLDKALRLYPIEAEEQCSSAVCRRISFMYNVLFEHDKLNKATHDTLHETFGTGNVKLFEHLARMNREGRLVDREGEDVYLPNHGRLSMPILLLSGAENITFTPEANQKTLAWLKRKNGPGGYDYVEIPDYGHIDCIFGKSAVDEVFPHFLKHFDRTA